MKRTSKSSLLVSRKIHKKLVTLWEGAAGVKETVFLYLGNLEPPRQSPDFEAVQAGRLESYAGKTVSDSLSRLRIQILGSQLRKKPKQNKKTQQCK